MDYFHFRVGTLDCATVTDGDHPFPRRNLFWNADEAQLDAALRPYGAAGDQLILPFHSLVVRVAGLTVLIDPGTGGFGASSGRLQANLRAAGIPPDAIDVVMLSHGHADHGGGAVDAAGNPAFPRARYVMSRREFDFWMDERASAAAGRRGAMARARLAPLASRFEWMEAGGEPLPGVRAVAAPGHTPHNLAIEIESGTEPLLYVADAIAHPIHLEHPDWYPEADLDPAEAIRTRRELLDRAVRGRMTVCAYHMPFPAGRVVALDGARFAWQPVKN